MIVGGERLFFIDLRNNIIMPAVLYSYSDYAEETLHIDVISFHRTTLQMVINSFKFKFKFKFKLIYFTTVVVDEEYKKHNIKEYYPLVFLDAVAVWIQNRENRDLEVI